MSFVQSMQDYKNKKGNMIFHSVSLENGNYTTIQNSVLLNINLSDKAVRVFGLMLMHRFNPSFQMNNFFLANALNCDIKTIQRSCKELKTLGYLDIYPTGEMRGNAPVYEYEIYENPIVNLEVADKGSGQRQQTKPAVKNVLLNKNINKNINNNDDNNTKKNHHEISDLENVENSVIEFADKADIKKTNDFFDEIIFNSGIFNFPMNDQRIKNIKLDNIPKSIKKNNLSLVLEVIKNFPGYVQKTNDGLNPKGSFSENEMLIYFKTILANDCKYPKWFNDLSKQEEVQKQVNSLEDSWKSITNIWKAQGNRIDDSIKIMITNIMEFIQDYEYHKKNDLVYDKKIMIDHFNTSINQTLSKKSALEMMDIIKEYTSRKWLGVDPFKKQIDSFLNDGLTLETIKSYFDSRGIQ